MVCSASMYSTIPPCDVVGIKSLLSETLETRPEAGSESINCATPKLVEDVVI